MTAGTNNIRVAVIGCGAFGRNHARVYRQLQQEGAGVEFVAVVDGDSQRAKSVAAEFGTKSQNSIGELRGQIDAASIAVPTIHHLSTARQIMESGADVLVEKPVASTLREADELIAVASRTGRIAQVGHLERFNPAVMATVPLVTQPMFFEVHRLSVFTPRSLDVDVVMDLMIHDLDVVLSLVKSSVREIRAVGLPVISDKVDIANVRIEFDTGCVANFTASRVSTEKVRSEEHTLNSSHPSISYAVFCLKK